MVLDMEKNIHIWTRDGDKWISNDEYQSSLLFLHRDGGPALIDADGTKEWWVDGKRHRLDGPAIESADGSKVWYKDGKLHRIDGPALEFKYGTNQWYVNGELHRHDGPAVEGVDGSNAWYLNGGHIPLSWFKENDIDPYNTTKQDLVLIKMTWG